MPLLAIAAILIVVFGLPVLITALMVLERRAPKGALGICPGCRAYLTKGNMSDGPCLDQRFYCMECRRSGKCGCNVRIQD